MKKTIDIPNCCGINMQLKREKGICGYNHYYICKKCNKKIIAKEFIYGNLNN
jgi:hypothetical protein